MVKLFKAALSWLVRALIIGMHARAGVILRDKPERK